MVWMTSLKRRIKISMRAANRFCRAELSEARWAASEGRGYHLWLLVLLLHNDPRSAVRGLCGDRRRSGTTAAQCTDRSQPTSREDRPSQKKGSLWEEGAAMIAEQCTITASQSKKHHTLQPLQKQHSPAHSTSI